MKKWILKELVLKIDFEAGEVEIGWVWIFLYFMPKAIAGMIYLLCDMKLLYDIATIRYSHITFLAVF